MAKSVPMAMNDVLCARDMRRFIVHRCNDDSSEGGEQWAIVDTHRRYHETAFARTKRQAWRVADALEVFAMNAAVDDCRRVLG